MSSTLTTSNETGSSTTPDDLQAINGAVGIHHLDADATDLSTVSALDGVEPGAALAVAAGWMHLAAALSAPDRADRGRGAVAHVHPVSVSLSVRGSAMSSESISCSGS